MLGIIRLVGIRNFLKIARVFRAYASYFKHLIVAHMRLPLSKIFSSFVHFCPNFKYFTHISCAYLYISVCGYFCPFLEKSNTYPYFLEYALTELPPGLLISKKNLHESVYWIAILRFSFYLIFHVWVWAEISTISLNTHGKLKSKII